MQRDSERRVRAAVMAALIPAMLACPGERRNRAASDTTAAIPVDTMPMDLSKVETSLPPALPDTFKETSRPTQQRSAGEVDREPPIPPAPPALMDAVARERSVSRFCYQEFGQKLDPSLTGGVAFVVSVGASGITDAKVASDSWTSKAGKGVNRCLDDRVASAWKLGAGAVPAGRYVVRMTFTGR